MTITIIITIDEPLLLTMLNAQRLLAQWQSCWSKMSQALVPVSKNCCFRHRGANK